MEKLFKNFPLLYRDVCYGFGAGDGWFQIIYDLSEQLEPLLVVNQQEQIAYISQLKEKFGGLTIYFNGPITPEITKLVEQAENKSFMTCENCGEPGRLRTERSWIKTLCDECNLQ